MAERAAARGSKEIRARPRPLCPLCDRPGDWLHTRLVDRRFGAPGEWGYRRCGEPSCGLLWIDPLPCEEDLAVAYRDYYTHGEDTAEVAASRSRPPRASGVWGLSDLLWRATRVAGVRDRLERLLLDRRPPGRLLELGCGAGDRLAALREVGWQVEGQELDPVAADRARRRHGLTVHLGHLPDLGLSAESFDAIASSHVLEHVHDPVGLLRECRRLLQPSGVLTAITPNAEGPGPRLFGADWLYVDPPRHLQVFCPRNLATIARRAGFAPTVWTTSARAQTVAASSLDVRRGRSSPPHTLARSIRDLAAALFQLAAQAGVLLAPDSGVECVLLAVPERR